MDISLIVNSIGLLLDVVGALLMFFNSQPVNFVVRFNDRAQNVQLMKIAKRKNQRIKLGAFLLFLGFILQLISNWI
jgi:hypothetical protein